MFNYRPVFKTQTDKCTNTNSNIHFEQSDHLIQLIFGTQNQSSSVMKILLSWVHQSTGGTGTGFRSSPRSISGMNVGTNPLSANKGN
jgi:hypothetical protein